MTQSGTNKNAFTIDVEDYYQVEAFSKVVDRSTWSTYPSRVEANTDLLLEMLQESGVEATFFVLGCVAEQAPSIVKKIAAAGHEVASHGYSHRLIYSQRQEDFIEETRRSKAILEDQAQQEVIGYRAATYSITKNSLWALDVLTEAGFKYDSSIFPIYHDRYGIPGAPVAPHIIETESGGIVEFPVTVTQLGRYNLPIAGGGYFRLFPYFFSKWGLGKVVRSGRPFVFYLHPWEVDPDQPRISSGSLSTQFRHYVNLNRVQDRLRCLFRDFPLGTARDVLQQTGLLDQVSHV